MDAVRIIVLLKPIKLEAIVHLILHQPREDVPEPFMGAVLVIILLKPIKLEAIAP
jgi:hypothetical protein